MARTSARRRCRRRCRRSFSCWSSRPRRSRRRTIASSGGCETPGPRRHASSALLRLVPGRRPGRCRRTATASRWRSTAGAPSSAVASPCALRCATGRAGALRQWRGRSRRCGRTVVGARCPHARHAAITAGWRACRSLRGRSWPSRPTPCACTCCVAPSSSHVPCWQHGTRRRPLHATRGSMRSRPR